MRGTVGVRGEGGKGRVCRPSLGWGIVFGETQGRSSFCFVFSRPVGAHGYIIAATQGLRFASSLGWVLGARWAVPSGRRPGADDGVSGEGVLGEGVPLLPVWRCFEMSDRCNRVSNPSRCGGD